MFSDLAAVHIRTCRNQGRIQGATHVGTEGSPGDGPYAVIYLDVSDGVITRASYETNGCPTSLASAGVLTTIITGRPVEKALLIEAEDLLKLIGPIPDGKEDCPPRAVKALKRALGTA